MTPSTDDEAAILISNCLVSQDFFILAREELSDGQNVLWPVC